MFGNDNMIRPRKIIAGSWRQKAPSEPPENKIRERKKAKKILQQFEDYCENSTLHGLKYIGNAGLTFGERIFWFVAFGAAFCFAVYYISNIFAKWNDNPVIIAYSPNDVGFNEFPFPAITICNMNQAKKWEAQRILSEGNEQEINLLNKNCNNFSKELSKNRAPNWKVLLNFMLRVGHSCSDTIKSCIWQSVIIDCERIFNNDLTDEGLCCSFNRLPPSMIFRNANEVSLLNHTFGTKIYDWSPETGFPDENDGDLDVVPLRPAGSGTHLGLTLVLDAHLDEYFCSSTDSTGFKVRLSNPDESPRIADFGYFVPTGVEARYAIKPVIRESSRTLRHIPINKRRCFFQNERPLVYYRAYSQRNCYMECQSNYTLRKCGCIPFFLPKNRRVTICGKGDDECVERARENMELVYGNGSSCYCLPGCYEMKFEEAMSLAKLYSINPKHNLQNTSTEYFLDNMAVLNFYFRDNKFQKQVKNEIYGFTEAISNIGGLLGLCLGFSILSAVEVVYHLSLRLFCVFLHSKRGRNHKGPTNIPFVK